MNIEIQASQVSNYTCHGLMSGITNVYLQCCIGIITRGDVLDNLAVESG